MMTPKSIIKEIEAKRNKTFEEIDGIFWDVSGMDYTGRVTKLSGGYSLHELDVDGFYMLKKDGKQFRTVRLK